jgi:hypothetical protein
MTFNCAKMRNSEEVNFTSRMDWTSLRVGPESAVVEEVEVEDDEEDVPWNKAI